MSRTRIACPSSLVHDFELLTKLTRRHEALKQPGTRATSLLSIFPCAVASPNYVAPAP